MACTDDLNLDRPCCESRTADMWYVVSSLLSGGSGAGKKEILQ